MLIITRGKKPVSQNGIEEEVLEQFQQAQFVHFKILSKMEKVLLCFQSPLNPSKEVSSSNVSCKLWFNLSYLLMKEMDSGSMNFLGVDLLLMENKIQSALSNFKVFCDSFSQMCSIKITCIIDNC